MYLVKYNMFRLLAKWWKELGQYEEELARQGIYHYHSHYGQPTYIENPQLREVDDRQETSKRITKKTKR